MGSSTEQSRGPVMIKSASLLCWKKLSPLLAFFPQEDQVTAVESKP